jgi:CubicO group peptidase (beta-lactamase class C family)
MHTHDHPGDLPFTHPLTRRGLLTFMSAAAIASALGPPLIGAARGTPTATTAAGTEAEFDAILASGVENGVPGIAVGVERGGELVYSGVAGVSSLEQQTPIQPADRFGIYSITKMFTAVVVLQLVDEGTLTLADTVTQWLDDPAVGRIPNVDTVTVEQLLRHTSGIYDFGDDNDSPFWEDAFTGPDADWTKVWTNEELLSYADGANHAPYFAPGTGDYYSNTNYLLLGMIVERASGHHFRDELQTRILDPLALSDTELAEAGDGPIGVVDAYHLVEGEIVNVTSPIVPSWAWTAGGIISTTKDLLRFARAVFSGELLSEASFTQMLTFVPSSQPGNEGLEWGMGMYRFSTANGHTAGMDGGSAGFTSHMARHIEGDVTVVALANLGNDGTPGAICNEVIAWMLDHPA